MSGLLTAGARLVDAATGATWTGTRLTAAVEAVAAALSPLPAGPVLCLTRNDTGSVLRYLGVRAAGRPAILWDAGTAAGEAKQGRQRGPAHLPDPLHEQAERYSGPNQEVQDLVERFAPAAVLGLSALGTAAASRPEAPPGYAVGQPDPLGPAWLRHAAAPVVPHEQLSLLLATSGSTGRPRLVRQSGRSGAGAIVAALRIEGGDVAITSLPLFYTLGLSVLHSHLLAGATVVVEERGVLDAGFWSSVDRYRVTGVTGVPHTYELLIRKRWRPADNPSVRTLCVSGGRLRDPVVTHLHAAMQRHGGAFYVMYGQTEAGSRISVLPPERLPAALGSVGPPVPGMRLSIAPDQDGGADPPGGGDGEVVCHSEAVMMGYAESAEDLARGDDRHGTLRTGDRGHLDDDGYLWLSGRAGRIGKAYGVRVSLDAVEHVSSAIAPAAAVAGDDRILIWCEGVTAARLAEVVALVTRELRIHRTAVSVSAVAQLPRRPNGKVDYDALPV